MPLYSAKRLYKGRWINAALLASLLLTGCDSGKDDAVSSETSGYKVAEESGETKSTSDSTKANDPAAPPATANPAADNTANNTAANSGTNPAAPPATNTPPANQTAATPPANTPSANSPAASNPPANVPPPTVPSPNLPPMPTDNGAKTGGVISEMPSFATLQFPSSEAPADFVTFLLKTDQAIRDLSVYGSQGMIPELEFRKQALRIIEMKLAASTKLLGLGNLSPEQLRLGRKGKLQALSQLSSMGDVKANDELRIYADDIAASGDPELVHDAEVMRMGYAAEELMTGKTTDPKKLVAQVDKVFENEQYRGLPEFMQVQNVIGLLERMAFKTEADALTLKIGTIYENSENPELANAAWQLLARNNPATKSLRDAVDLAVKGDAAGLQMVSDATTQLIDQMKSDQTAVFLISQAINFEYSGYTPIARSILTAATPRVASVQKEDVRKQMTQLLESFDKRQGMIGKPFPTDGLIGLDGKPLDWTALKGKVVLVDFWASWCTPCLEELPNMETAYGALKDKGFEVIGINVDDNVADLQSFLTQRPLKWSTYRSTDETKVGLESPALTNYGITLIPFVAVVGKDGNVASLHIRGEKLMPEIEKLLAAPQ